MTIMELKRLAPVRENDNSHSNQALGPKCKHTGKRQKELGREKKCSFILFPTDGNQIQNSSVV